MAQQKDTKLKKWLVGEAQQADNTRFELINEPKAPVAPAVDAVAQAEAAEQRYVDLMTNPSTAPEWAKAATHGQHQAPPATAEEITAKLAALDEEQKLVAKALTDVQTKQRDVLNQQLNQQRAAEQKLLEDEATGLPGRLDLVRQEIEGFLPTGDEAPAQAYSEDNDPIRRGEAALARARRRLNGEQVEEPELPAYVAPVKPGESQHQTEVRARIAPALAAAAERQADLKLFENKIGSTLAVFYAEKGAERTIVEALMRGVPPTQPNLAACGSLVRSVQMIVEEQAVLVKTLTREIDALESVVLSIPKRGSMKSMGDHSTAYYLLERELTTSLMGLATVSTDAIQGLWSRSRDLERRLISIAKLRAENVGTVVPSAEWESKEGVLDEIRRAERMSDNGRASRAITNEKLFGGRD
jgi:hypothetical protein